MILDLIAERILRWKLIDQLEIRDLCIGYPYTYSVIKGDYETIGVALTPIYELSNVEVWRPPEINLSSTVRKAVEKLTSTHMLERALALATANAVSQYIIRKELNKLKYSRGANEETHQLINILEKAGVKRIAVIGNMAPLVKRLRERGLEVMVFERSRERRTDEVYSDCLEPRLLPRAEAVIITGATLINETLDTILLHARSSRINILIGPTAQIHPTLLKDVGVDYVASCHSKNPEETVKLLKLSGWRKALHKESMWYLMRVNETLDKASGNSAQVM